MEEVFDRMLIVREKIEESDLKRRSFIIYHFFFLIYLYMLVCKRFFWH
jgi:hypothetical protein